MSDDQLIVGTWDNACPSGVSYSEHIQGLPIVLVQLYFANGGKGVFLSNPMTVSMLVCTNPAFMGTGFEWNGPSEHSIEAGRLGGISIWVNMCVPPNEILIVDDPESLQPIAKLELTNFIDAPGPLDRMAQIK